MKKKTVITLSLLALFCAAVVIGIGSLKKARRLATPLNRDIVSVTEQEYLGEKAVNEIVKKAHDPDWNPDKPYFGIDGYRKIFFKGRIPPRDVSLRYVLTCKDGSEFVCYEFSDGKHSYIEVSNAGTYRSVHNDYFSLDSYYNCIYGMHYLDNAETKNFTLPENYTGAGKAIWIDLTDDHQWWDRFIPEAYEAAGPQEVRYLIICSLESKTYTGYWYNPQTGQRVSDAYDVTYTMSAFDLLTGEETVLIESTGNIFDIADNGILEKYFETHR